MTLIPERRRKCPNFKRCGTNTHYVKDGKWVQCACHVREHHERTLKEFFCEDPILDTTLLDDTRRNLILYGTRADVNRHVSGVILHMNAQGREFVSFNQDRLLDVFLGNDVEGEHSLAAFDRPDLVFLWLGYGDELPNKCRPDAINTLLARRALWQKTIWVHLNFAFKDLEQYGSAKLMRVLGEFDKIDV